MQKILLGNREIGECEIKARGVNWEEIPTLQKDRYRADKSLFLDLDKDNFNLLSSFYRDVVLGDNAEGLSSKVSTYYSIILVMQDGNLYSSFEFKNDYPDFDNYHTSDMPDDITYLVRIN